MTLRYIVRPLTAAARLQMTGNGTEITPFRATWANTLNLLDTELRAIRGRDVVLMVNCSDADLRLDGQLRGNAKPASPHVALTFTTPPGPLLFCCGRFRTWQDNARAITLGLQALRKIDRYGIITAHEQYDGFRAIPETTSDPTVEAWTILAAHSGLTLAAARLDPKTAYRTAMKATHPDQGGNPDAFRRVQAAARLLAIT